MSSCCATNTTETTPCPNCTVTRPVVGGFRLNSSYELQAVESLSYAWRRTDRWSCHRTRPLHNIQLDDIYEPAQYDTYAWSSSRGEMCCWRRT